MVDKTEKDATVAASFSVMVCFSCFPDGTPIFKNVFQQYDSCFFSSSFYFFFDKKVAKNQGFGYDTNKTTLRN
jgi:hypothetical protein